MVVTNWRSLAPMCVVGVLFFASFYVFRRYMYLAPLKFRRMASYPILLVTGVLVVHYISQGQLGSLLETALEGSIAEQVALAVAAALTAVFLISGIGQFLGQPDHPPLATNR